MNALGRRRLVWWWPGAAVVITPVKKAHAPPTRIFSSDTAERERSQIPKVTEVHARMSKAQSDATTAATHAGGRSLPDWPPFERPGADPVTQYS